MISKQQHHSTSSGIIDRPCSAEDMPMQGLAFAGADDTTKDDDEILPSNSNGNRSLSSISISTRQAMERIQQLEEELVTQKKLNEKLKEQLEEKQTDVDRLLNQLEQQILTKQQPPEHAGKPSSRHSTNKAAALGAAAAAAAITRTKPLSSPICCSCGASGGASATTRTTTKRRRRHSAMPALGAAAASSTRTKPLDDVCVEETTEEDDDLTTTTDMHSSATAFEQLEELLRFLFLEARQINKAKDFVRQFSQRMIQSGLPIDRLFIGGMVTRKPGGGGGQAQPHVALGFNWKWKAGDTDVDEFKVPSEILEKLRLNSNAPFARLEFEGLDQVRVTRGEGEIPYDMNWFEEEQYHDYLALPMKTQGKFLGGMAWSTKQVGGFTPDQIHVLCGIQNEFSTVMATHVYDIALHQATGVLEEEVANRTKQLKAANQSLERANVRVRAQSQAQLRHFAMMSHEIRTPLNCIVNMSSLLLEQQQQQPQLQQQEDGDWQDSIRMIHESGVLLCAVVNDVLDYSRLESGNVDMEIQSVNVRQTLRTVVDTIQHKAKEKGVEVQSQFASNLPHRLRIDGRRLQQILYNLMGNAVKFSHDNGTVDLTVSVVQEAGMKSISDDSENDIDNDNDDYNNASHQRIRFSVKDYGCGIKQSDVDKIFEPFTQASTATERLYGGTGLGLAITAKLVKAMQGSIHARSEFGSWSEFVVDFQIGEDPPQEQQQQQQALGEKEEKVELEKHDKPNTRRLTAPSNLQPSSSTATAESVPFPSLPKVAPKLSNNDAQKAKIAPAGSLQKYCYKNMRVLIVEDIRINQKILEKSLKAIGLTEITIVDNGLKAVEISAVKTFDCILMDIQMPVMDGLEACRRIVQRGKDTCIPAPKILFLTAHAFVSFQAEAEAAGGSGFISKPFNRKKIEEYFQTLDLADAVERQNGIAPKVFKMSSPSA